jgi:hypothetical protein
MNDDSDKLVLAATFEDPAEAALARNQLESMGIRAVLGEENAANLGWAATGAEGGIKLLVADADLARSRYLLAVKPWLEKDEPEETAIATPENLQKIAVKDEDEEPPSPREQQATRAFKSAVLGLVLPPLIPYAIYLLGVVCFTRGKLQGRPRSHAVYAALVLGMLLAGLGVVVGVAYLGPLGKDPGLRLLTHPAPLIGKWQGKTKANMVVDLDLDAKGNMRCKLTTAEVQEWTGSWAYDNHTLLLQVEKVLSGPPPPNKFVGWEMDSMADGNNEMFLKDEGGLLRLVRQR